jgi:hypothetical protein
MIGAKHAARGAPDFILVDTPASIELSLKAGEIIRAGLPQETQDMILKHETDGGTHDEEYQDAMGSYYARHLCRMHPMPEQVFQSFAILMGDPTVSHTMCALTLSARWRIDDTQVWLFGVFRRRYHEGMDRNQRASPHHGIHASFQRTL